MSTTAAGDVGQGVATIRQARLPGFSTPEFGHEALGHGWQHTKLHLSLMREAA